MITLYNAGPLFGLPDPSPFVVKAMVLLKMAGVPFESRLMSFREAPKGKIPYIRDNGVLLGDSHFIQTHLTDKHDADYSGGYGPRETALGWTIARMCEDHLYWLLVHDRWENDKNFEKGPKHYFDVAPAPIRPVLRHVIRKQVRKALKAQGLGRHTDAERLQLGKGDVDAVADLLGSNTYLLGPRSSGADASVFAMLWGASVPFFNSELGEYIRLHKPVMGYVTRMREQFFPEFPA